MQLDETKILRKEIRKSKKCNSSLCNIEIWDLFYHIIFQAPKRFHIRYGTSIPVKQSKFDFLEKENIIGLWKMLTVFEKFTKVLE